MKLLVAESAGFCFGVRRIEEARELHPKWFAKTKKVGLTAGASTPYWIIREVEAGIKDLAGRNP